MTDKELRDAAVKELKLTTVGYKNKHWTTPPNGSRWDNGLDLLAQIGQVAPPPPPPPPPPTGKPIPAGGTISAGGTYGGSFTGTVQIKTDQPVKLQGFRGEVHGSSQNINADYPGADLTLIASVLEGEYGHSIYSQGFRRIWVENSEILGGWGVRPGTGKPGCVCVLKNSRFVNQLYVAGQSPHNVAHPFQVVETPDPSHAEISWCEFIAEPYKSQTEDVVSVYLSSKFKVHDCLIHGAWPNTLTEQYSGGGVLVDSGDDANLNEIYNMTVLDTMNYCIAISGGRNNKLYRSRAFSTHQDPQGRFFTGITSQGNGMVLMVGGPEDNNIAFENVVGANWIHGGRNDWYCPAAANDIEAENTHYDPSKIVDKAKIAVELDRWKQKVATAGVKIGLP